MRRLLFSFLILLSVLSLEACHFSTRQRPLVELAPSSSFVVLSVNWSKVKREATLKRMIKGVEIEKLFHELGINSDYVDELVLFSDIQIENGGANGIIMRGSYKTRGILDSLKAQGWTENSYQGYKVYSNVSNSEWFAILKSSSMVLGTREGVEGAIRAEKDPKLCFASNQSYKKLVTNLSRERPPISLMVAFPVALQDMASASLKVSSFVLDLAGFGLLGAVMDRIGFVRGFGCSVSRNSNSFPVELVAIMQDEETAGLISGSLNMLKELTRAAPKGSMLPSDVEIAQSIQNMVVTRNHDVLQIRALITEGSLAR